ncbi:MAG TPA: diphthine--ammonia ligase [Nautiliaceae bacterium]|nr:diphthine--ammonia ligase [Nautiliaceae bacterium]
MRLACLYSGGKDSNLALFKALKNNYKVEVLVNLVPKNKDSFMFQSSNMSLVKLQSKALGIPLIQKITVGKKEKELEDLYFALLEAKKRFGIQGVLTGAINSIYQNSRIQRVANELDLFVFSPLWLLNPIKELNELIKHKFKVIIVKISSYPLTKDLLGKGLKEVYDFLIKNKDIINPAGEGGEYETFVLKSPLFKKEIKVLESEIKEENKYVAELLIKKAELV